MKTLVAFLLSPILLLGILYGLIGRTFEYGIEIAEMMWYGD